MVSRSCTTTGVITPMLALPWTYLGLQDPAYKLLRQAEQGQPAVTIGRLEQAAPSQAAEQSMQLSAMDRAMRKAADLKHAPILNAAWVAKHSVTMSREPEPDESKFEECFPPWEFQLAKYAQDNNTLTSGSTELLYQNGQKKEEESRSALNIGCHRIVHSKVTLCSKAPLQCSL